VIIVGVAVWKLKQTSPLEARQVIRFSHEMPEEQLSGGLRSLAVSPDGKRFLILKDAKEVPRKINIVVNWLEELKESVPVSKN
jgi:hypothetical protein